MKKIIFAILLFLPCTLFAESESVTARKSCSELQTEIRLLTELEEITDEERDNLMSLQGQYRSSCAKSGARRAMNAKTKSHIESDVVTVTADEEVAKPTEEVDESQQLSDEEIQANLDAGLCPNGEKYNKFGCCPGERFTDLGDAGYACCEIDNKDICYPAKGMNAE